MKAKKAQVRLQRALKRSNGLETRHVRRARWASLGNGKPPWKPLYRLPTISREQYEEGLKNQREVDHEVKRNNVLSMVQNIRSMFSRAVTRRHQAR